MKIEALLLSKTPPASVLITKAAGIEKGSGESAKGSVGNISKAQLEEIAKTKLPDLNCSSVESAMKVIEGTARNMGVSILIEFKTKLLTI